MNTFTTRPFVVVRQVIQTTVSAFLAFFLAQGAARADDLTLLNDEFNHALSLARWQNRHAVETPGVNPFIRLEVDADDHPAALLMQPQTVTWFGGYRGPLLYKEITGDFAITTRVTVTNTSSTGQPVSTYSLAGPMIRTPLASPHAPENYVFLSVGYGDVNHPSNPGPGPHFEVKTTINGNSTLQLSPSQTLDVTLQIARIGDTVVTLFQRPGEDWTVREVYQRADMPETLQAGLVAYTDWDKVSTYSPDFHNTHTLAPPIPGDPSSNPARPFRPDVVAEFDFARYSRLFVPDGVDPATASDEVVLTFLGDAALPPPLLEGDMNLDGQVNAEDVARFVERLGQSALGQEATDAIDGDFNYDGQATLTDLWLLQANLSPTLSPVGTTPIPEPNTLVALLTAAIVLNRKVRRGTQKGRAEGISFLTDSSS